MGIWWVHTDERNTVEKKGTGTWYTELGTVEKPSSQPGMVELWRAGKFIALVAK